jgi:hypothetical protein
MFEQRGYRKSEAIPIVVLSFWLRFTCGQSRAAYKKWAVNQKVAHRSKSGDFLKTVRRSFKKLFVRLKS